MNWYLKHIFAASSKLSKEDIQEIVRLFSPIEKGGENLTVKQISDRYSHVVPSTIYRILMKHFPGFAATRRTIKRFDPAENIVQQIVHLLNEGNSIQAISSIFNIDPMTLTKYLKKKRIAYKGRQNYIKRQNYLKQVTFDPPDQQIINLLNEGNSLKTIAFMFDIDPHTLANYLKRKGIDYRKRQEYLEQTAFNPPDNVVQKIINLINEGNSVNAIASMIGISDTTLIKYLKKKGINYKGKTEATKHLWQSRGGFWNWIWNFPPEKRKEIIGGFMSQIAKEEEHVPYQRLLYKALHPELYRTEAIQQQNQIPNQIPDII